MARVGLWLMSTRRDSHGTVTANTYVRLETETWAAIQKWHGLCLTAPLVHLHDQVARAGLKTQS